jgi:hypothetical protein
LTVSSLKRRLARQHGTEWIALKTLPDKYKTTLLTFSVDKKASANILFVSGKQWHAWGSCSSPPVSDTSTNLDSLELVDAIGRGLEDEDVDPAFLSDSLRMCEAEAVEPDTKAVRYAIPVNR